MKFAILLLALICPLQAELLATVQTSHGNVLVALQYDKAPQAVASFMTLAQGTRKYVNSLSGVVTNVPFYNGIKIHRCSNTDGFKFAQGGSPKGDGSDGPGYAFKDEFDPSLTHVPYVLSMANAGPNTNGSQFFFTGSVPQPTFNNVHTIFGLVTDLASRSVVDAMIAAGANGTTLTGVTFSRTDATANSFNEHAQYLPEVTCPGGSLTVHPGVSNTWHLGQAMSTGAVFRAFRTPALATGTVSELDSARLHVGITAPATPPAVLSVVLDQAALPSAFYNLSLARHPGAVAPSTLANRTVAIPFGSDTLTFAFDASGVAGTTTYTPQSGSPFGGPFTTVNQNNGLPMPPQSDAHSIFFTADTPILNPRYLWVKVGCDSTTTTTITGRHSTQSYNYGWQPFASGSVTINR